MLMFVYSSIQQLLQPYPIPLPPPIMSHLDTPSQWATGSDAPPDKQNAFISTLAADKGADVDPNNINKSEASAKINELKSSDTKNPGATAGKPIQNPDTWSTGDDKATGKQTGYIAAMAQRAGDKVETQGMGKTEASKTIEDLKGKTGM